MSAIQLGLRPHLSPCLDEEHSTDEELARVQVFQWLPLVFRSSREHWEDLEMPSFDQGPCCFREAAQAPISELACGLQLPPIMPVEQDVGNTLCMGFTMGMGGESNF